jgi:hypothetical protein
VRTAWTNCACSTWTLGVSNEVRGWLVVKHNHNVLGRQLVLLVLLILCGMAATAATLPPMPPGMESWESGKAGRRESGKGTAAHKRPAPLCSPKHSARSKDRPMVKATTFAAASYSSLRPVLIVLKHRNLLGCNTNDSSCVMWDYEDIKVEQPAGVSFRVELANVANATERATVATFSAAPFDVISEIAWPHPEDQTPPERYFFAVRTPATTKLRTTSNTAAPEPVVNPVFKNKGVLAWTTRKKRI